MSYVTYVDTIFFTITLEFKLKQRNLGAFIRLTHAFIICDERYF